MFHAGHLLGLLAISALVLVVGCASPPASDDARPDAGHTSASTEGEHRNLGPGALALQGYDPVAYFPEGGGEAAKGKMSIAANHAGATYRFVNEANRDRFRSNPAKYAPAYGGWCAYAVADGQKVEINPEAFLIQDGRLLVFYNAWGTDTRQPWSEDPTGYAERADERWQSIASDGKREDFGDQTRKRKPGRY